MENKIKSFSIAVENNSITVKKGDYFTKRDENVVMQFVVNKVNTSTVEVFINKLHSIEPGKTEEISILKWIQMHTESTRR